MCETRCDNVEDAVLTCLILVTAARAVARLNAAASAANAMRMRMILPPISSISKVWPNYRAKACAESGEISPSSQSCSSASASQACAIRE